MTNLEHYCISAEPINDNSDIKLFISDDDWRLDWWESKHKTLKDWLLAEYKPYKLSQFEYDLLTTFDKWKESGIADSFYTLNRLKEKGYFKNVDMTKTVFEILERCEVISDV